MNKRKYEIMEAHLKGEITVVDLIDKIVELEEENNLHNVERLYMVEEYVIPNLLEAQDILRKLCEYADLYGTVSVAVYYDFLGEQSSYVDNGYGWNYNSIRKGASVISYRSKFNKPRNNGYIIKFPPVGII